MDLHLYELFDSGKSSGIVIYCIGHGLISFYSTPIYILRPLPPSLWHRLFAPQSPDIHLLFILV